MISKTKGRNVGNSLDIGIVVLLVCLVIFFGRCIYILKDNNERGGLVYVELLNFSMPLVETQVYEEGAYYENNLSLKNIALQAVGLYDISAQKLVNSENPIFKLDERIAKNNGVEDYKPFELDEGSIIKYTDEERNNLYNPKLKKELNKSKPEVLIYHTHTGEGYLETKNFTNDPNHNVVGVGNIITKELEKYGISVIHDKTVHDNSYNDSYNRSRQTVKRYYDKLGDKFKLVIDIHRDGVNRKKATQTTKNAFTTKINGEDVGKIAYVVSKGSKNYTKSTKKVEDELSKITKSLYPGLSKGTVEYTNGINHFNQDIFNNSILIEVGANINTSKEVMNSAKYIGRIIAEYINGKK